MKKFILLEIYIHSKEKIHLKNDNDNDNDDNNKINNKNNNRYYYYHYYYYYESILSKTDTFRTLPDSPSIKERRPGNRESK